MPLLPAFLLACFAFWSGTFPGAAAFPAGPVGQGLVLAAALLAAAAWRDPLGLGRAGRWLAAALVVAVLLSLWVSPVARAGRVGVWLLPAYLLLAPFVARCWSTDRRREIGLAAWSVVVAATALWAIVEQLRQRVRGAAMPLGHHNLLAAFLVSRCRSSCRPCAAAGSPGGWRARDRRGWSRWSRRALSSAARHSPSWRWPERRASNAPATWCSAWRSSAWRCSCRAPRRSSSARTPRPRRARSICSVAGRERPNVRSSAGGPDRYRGRSPSTCGPYPGSIRRAKWSARCTRCRWLGL